MASRKLFACACFACLVFSASSLGQGPPSCPADPIVEFPQERAWGEVGYLLWWVKGGPGGVPLVTTGGPADPRVLFGGSGVDYGTASGLKANLGGWLDERATVGVEAGGFLLERRASGFAATSDADGNPPLQIPFYDPAIGAQTGVIGSSPVGQRFAGEVAAASHSRLWGFHAAAVRALNPCGPIQIDALLGYRRLALDEDLSLGVANRDLALDIQNRYSDRFAVRNRFDGGQLGVRLTGQLEGFYFLAQGDVSIGNSALTIDRAGTSLQTGADAFAPGPHAGGILVQPTSAGRDTRNAFAVVPSAQARVGVHLLPWLSASVGYEFLYWSSVVRPGDQIDPAVNTSQSAIFGGGRLAGEARPARLFDQSDFFAHGLRFGVEVYY